MMLESFSKRRLRATDGNRKSTFGMKDSGLSLIFKLIVSDNVNVVGKQLTFGCRGLLNFVACLSSLLLVQVSHAIYIPKRRN